MNPLEGDMASASELGTVSTKQQRIAQLAGRSPAMALTSLAHLIDLDWLKEAYRRTRKDGAVGADGMTAATYEQDREANLRDLLERAKSGRYQAPPRRRAHIPKGTGTETRPIGIPTPEDKVLQRAVLMLLEPIYERDFAPWSYGFRPGRSAHQALDGLWKQSLSTGGGWVIDVDIRKFFDTLDHGHLRELLRRRVRDGVVLRLIGDWLNAGVLDQGELSYPDAGSPQGGVISPLLANIYRHYVLDEWFAEAVRPRLRGRAFVVRYADDFVMAFSSRGDAERVRDVLPKRFAKYGLALHPTKTRMIRFGPPEPDGPNTPRGDSGPSETFDFLGFTPFWRRSRRGNWVVGRKTAKSRFGRALKSINQWCRAHRHDDLGQQHAALSRKLLGHNASYGITGNGPSLQRFRFEVGRIWKRWLGRRSQRSHRTWGWFNQVLARYPLPAARVIRATRHRAANA
jgi:RNA-directed DNA polymerase